MSGVSGTAPGVRVAHGAGDFGRKRDQGPGEAGAQLVVGEGLGRELAVESAEEREDALFVEKGQLREDVLVEQRDQPGLLELRVQRPHRQVLDGVFGVESEHDAG